MSAKAKHHFVSFLVIGFCIWMLILALLYGGTSRRAEIVNTWAESSSEVVKLSRAYNKSFGTRVRTIRQVQDVSLRAQYRGGFHVYILEGENLISHPRYSLGDRVDIYINPENQDDFRVVDDVDPILDKYDLAIPVGIVLIALVAVVSWRIRSYKELCRSLWTVKDYSEAIRLDPEDADLWQGRGVAYFAEREYSQALKDFSKAIRLEPDNASWWWARGVVYEEMGDEAKAKAHFSKAKELDKLGIFDSLPPGEAR